MAVLAVVVVLVPASFFLSPSLQAVLNPHYTTEQAVQAVQGLLLNMGTALIGAAAIVTSLVLFAMQVNIERMPHGLFRRLSEDLRLLGAFAVSFLLAIGVVLTIDLHGTSDTRSCLALSRMGGIAYSLVIPVFLSSGIDPHQPIAATRDTC